VLCISCHLLVNSVVDKERASSSISVAPNTLSGQHVFLALWLSISKTGLLSDVDRQEIVSSAVCSHVF
jgi:hypothetical protein